MSLSARNIKEILRMINLVEMVHLLFSKCTISAKLMFIDIVTLITFQYISVRNG